MVSSIDIKEERKDLLAQSKIKCSEKNISQIFSFLASELSKKNFIIENVSERNLVFGFKHKTRKINGNIEDISEENFLDVCIYSNPAFLPRRVQEWMDKQFLGLRYGLWTFLVVIAAILSTLIAVGRKNPDFLKYLGISLISIGGFSIIVFFMLRKFLINNSIQRKDKAENIVQLVNEIIERYTQRKPENRICWNCFQELKTETKECPKCKSKI